MLSTWPPLFLQVRPTAWCTFELPKKCRGPVPPNLWDYDCGTSVQWNFLVEIPFCRSTSIAKEGSEVFAFSGLHVTG